ncbi:MAG: T9SS type A sorting domain-containing protein [candidate division WOR-3 bacterium]|nr:T9SS type A sorting domain-containing protein [candidate division WOR-3 bacterium]
MVFFLVLLQIVNLNPDFGIVIAQHDTGNVIMKVTARGCIGDTVTGTGNITNGFKYPRTGQDWLFFGGFAVGNSITYVADGHYAPGGLTSHDFRVVDSLERVFRHGAQEWECRYNDSGHPTPKNLRVKQYSIGSPNSLYDDGVIMEFTIENEDTVNPVNDLYAALMFDFDMGTSNLTMCGSDTIRRCVWMRQYSTDNPTIGTKILYPESWANLACVDHRVYIYPDTGFADSSKYKFMSGMIRMYSSPRNDDWTILASIGPFSLEPAQEYTCAFAILGGANLNDFYANADSMQSYYQQIISIEENQTPKFEPTNVKISCLNPFKENGLIKLQVSEKCAIKLNLYDALGRYVKSVWQGAGPCNEDIILDTQNLPTGLYFLRLNTGKMTKTLKVIISR